MQTSAGRQNKLRIGIRAAKERYCEKLRSKFSASDFFSLEGLAKNHQLQEETSPLLG